MIVRYRPRLAWTTYAGKPRRMWRAFDSEGHWAGHHATEDGAWQAMGFVAWCACGHVYTAQDWAELELVGEVDGALEQRNCLNAAADRRIAAAIELMKRDDVAAALRAEPHPQSWRAEQGATRLDWCEWMLDNAGRAGKTKVARRVEAAAKT